MRAVLDTNVLVSAVLSRGGAPDRVLRAWRDGAFELLTSRALLDELERVLARPRIAERLGWVPSESRVFVAALAESAIVADASGQLKVVAADPDNDRVIDAAVEGEADYIVSGDRHLLDLGSYGDIPVVTAAGFAALLAVE